MTKGFKARLDKLNATPSVNVFDLNTERTEFWVCLEENASKQLIADRLKAEGLGKSARNQWICEAIKQFYEMVQQETEEDAIQYIKIQLLPLDRPNMNNRIRIYASPEIYRMVNHLNDLFKRARIDSYTISKVVSLSVALRLASK